MAVAYSTSCIFTEILPNAGHKEIVIESPTTMVASDTVVVTLADYGLSTSGVLTVNGYIHTTAGSVIATDAPTTVVEASGVLTITAPTRVGVGYRRIYRVVGNSF